MGYRGFAGYICLVATNVLVQSWKYSAIFETIPNEADLDGLGCAWQSYKSERVIMFDTPTQTCKIPEMMSNLSVHMRPDFRAGDAFVLYLERVLGAVGRNEFNFWYADADGHGFYRVDNTNPNQVGSLTFATHINGDSNYKMVDDPFQPTETSYKVELYIQSDKITMYVNDDVMYSSSHTVDVSDYRTAHFKGTNLICTSYQFIY